MRGETPTMEGDEFQGKGQTSQSKDKLEPNDHGSLTRREVLKSLGFLGGSLLVSWNLPRIAARILREPGISRHLLITELFELTKQHPALLRPHLTPIPNFWGKGGDYRVPTLVMGESHEADFPRYLELLDALLGIVEKGGNVVSFVENIPPGYLLANFQFEREIAFFEENKGFAIFVPPPQISFPTQYLNTMYLAQDAWNSLRERRGGVTEAGQYTMVFGDINILGDPDFLLVDKIAEAIIGGREAVLLTYFILSGIFLNKYEETKNRVYLLGLSTTLGRLTDYLISTLKIASRNEFEPPIENTYVARIMKTILGRLPFETVQRWVKEIVELREILWVIKTKEALMALHETPDLLTLHVGLGHLMLDLDIDLSQQTFDALVQLFTDLLELDPNLLGVNIKEINVGGRRFVLNQLTDWVSLTLLPDGRAMLVCRRSEFISDALATAIEKVRDGENH